MALAVTDYAGHEITGVILYATDGSVLIGQKASAASLSTVPASDIPDPTYIGDIKFGEALPAGAAIVGKVGIDQTTPGTTNGVQVNAALPAGTNNIGDVDVATLPAGNLGQQLKAASLSVAPATDITDATYIGDVKFGEALPAGTAFIGQVTAGTAVTIGDAMAPVRLVQPHADASGSYPGPWQVIAPLLNPSGSYDRPRDIAASGAGLGVAQVGTLGELITLAASAARTAGANGTAVTGLGWRNRYIILCDITASATDAGDTLDVYIDVSLDGSTWLNAVHFTQQAGNGAARKEFAVLDPSAPGTAVINVTSDAAAAVVRPSLFGPQMRARWAIVDSGTPGDQSHTFSVVAYAI